MKRIFCPATLRKTIFPLRSIGVPSGHLMVYTLGKEVAAPEGEVGSEKFLTRR